MFKVYILAKISFFIDTQVLADKRPLKWLVHRLTQTYLVNIERGTITLTLGQHIFTVKQLKENQCLPWGCLHSETDCALKCLDR